MLRSSGSKRPDSRRLRLATATRTRILCRLQTVVLFCFVPHFNIPMPHFSDSNYAAVTRHRHPFSKSAVPRIWDRLDGSCGSDRLDNDDIVLSTTAHPGIFNSNNNNNNSDDSSAIPLHHLLLLDDDGDGSSSAVTPNSAAAANAAADRRRREEGWTDLGLDQMLLHHHPHSAISTSGGTRSTPSNGSTPAGGRSANTNGNE